MSIVLTHYVDNEQNIIHILLYHKYSIVKVTRLTKTNAKLSSAEECKHVYVVHLENFDLYSFLYPTRPAGHPYGTCQKQHSREGVGEASGRLFAVPGRQCSAPPESPSDPVEISVAAHSERPTPDMADLAQQFGENTLDEPVSETIMRDVRLVRLCCILAPPFARESRAELLTLCSTPVRVCTCRLCGDWRSLLCRGYLLYVMIFQLGYPGAVFEMQ